MRAVGSSGQNAGVQAPVARPGTDDRSPNRRHPRPPSCKRRPRGRCSSSSSRRRSRGRRRRPPEGHARLHGGGSARHSGKRRQCPRAKRGLSAISPPRDLCVYKSAEKRKGAAAQNRPLPRAPTPAWLDFRATGPIHFLAILLAATLLGDAPFVRQPPVFFPAPILASSALHPDCAPSGRRTCARRARANVRFLRRLPCQSGRHAW